MTISAPGKLMLFGEHAVVYGYPCIVTAISQRLDVSLSETDSIPGDRRFVDGAIAVWGAGRDIKVSTTCPFSGKYGFGSSSAVTVATLKALRLDADNRAVFDAALKIVLDIQGAGSGFDVAAATYGGTLYYVKNKAIEPLTIKDMPLVVGYTGVKADTKIFLADVAGKRAKEPEKVERIFGAIGKIVNEAKGKIIDGDWERAGKLMDFNQDYLRDLGVSSEKLEALIAAARAGGAYGAKLSGAGGGDCMIALAPAEKRKSVEEAIVQAGGEVVRVKPNAQGVRVETTDNQEEVFIVVDRNDNILGYKTRYECHHDPSLIHRTVGALIYDTNGRLLLQKRSMTKDMEPGLWGISAAGHVTKDQTDEEAAHRELQEELGTDAPLTFIKKFITADNEETERAAVYRGVSDGPFHPDVHEVSDIKFYDPREIRLAVASKSLQMTKAGEQTLREVGIL